MSAPCAQVELAIPARADFLALARQVVVSVARTDDAFDDERLDDLRLAVSEACSNAIQAHSAIGSKAQIRISCRLRQGCIEVEVCDEGRGFDPDRVRSAPPAGDPERLFFESGLGIPLMQRIADHTEIRSSSAGTRVRMVLFAASALSA
jgi:serine/threonine-protein kinase RsbW